MVKLFQQQAELRLANVSKVPIQGMEQALRQNYEMGMAHGLVLASRLPYDVYEELRRVYVDKLEELRNESAAS